VRISNSRIGRINAIPKTAYKYGFCFEVFLFSDLAGDANVTLFSSMVKKQRYLQSILPDIKTSTLH